MVSGRERVQGLEQKTGVRAEQDSWLQETGLNGGLHSRDTGSLGSPLQREGDPSSKRALKEERQDALLSTY